MRKFIAVLFLAIGLSSCGYTTGSLLSSSYRNIAIEPFKNSVGFISENTRRLYVPLLETKVRNAIIDRFRFDGNLRVKEADKADLILRGELTGFEREELRVSENEDVQEYRIRITTSLVLTDASGVEIWSESAFSGEATYFITGPQAKSETDALNEALTDISRRVVERTIENW